MMVMSSSIMGHPISLINGIMVIFHTNSWYKGPFWVENPMDTLKKLWRKVSTMRKFSLDFLLTSSPLLKDLRVLADVFLLRPSPLTFQIFPSFGSLEAFYSWKLDGLGIPKLEEHGV